MEIITVHTTQNIDIDYEIGGLGERILARLIDFGIFIPFAFAGAFLASILSNLLIGIYFIALAVVFGFYDLLCEVFFNGQSFGKRVMKIRVISLDGSRPEFSQYLLRWLFRLVDFSITFQLGALISAAVSEKGQRIGDVVAGTALIKTTARTQMQNIVFANVDQTYQPVFTQASQLSDQDIGLIHEVIDNYFKTGNNQVVYNMAARIKEHLSLPVPPEMNSMQFLQTIIKDYSHITAQADAL
jgi:uncharacterized RDD family membrane protein YckC